MPSPSATPSPPADKSEAWLHHFNCPQYFDFEKALTVPCIESSSQNPPLLDSVYDSDEETRYFFDNLTREAHPEPSDPQSTSVHPELRNIRPVYHHRTPIPFEDYLRAHEENNITTPNTPEPPRSPESRLPPSCSVTPSRKSALSHSLHISSSVSPSTSPKKPAARRARHPERVTPPSASSVLGKSPSAAGRKTRPYIDRSDGSTVTKIGLPMRVCCAREAATPEKAPTVRNRSSHTTIKENEIKLVDVDEKDEENDKNDLVHDMQALGLSDDRRLVRLMKQHNRRVKQYPRDPLLQEEFHVRDNNVLPASSASSSVPGENYALRSSLNQIQDKGRIVDIESNERTSNEGVSNPELDEMDPNEVPQVENAALSLSDILNSENVRILEERKKRIPEQRKAFLAHRTSALRTFEGQIAAQREIRKRRISAKVEFTAASGVTKLQVRSAQSTNSVKRLPGSRKENVPKVGVVPPNTSGMKGMRGLRARACSKRGNGSTSTTVGLPSTISRGRGGVSNNQSSRPVSKTKSEKVKLSAKQKRVENSLDVDLQSILSQHNYRVEGKRRGIASAKQ